MATFTDSILIMRRYLPNFVAILASFGLVSCDTFQVNGNVGPFHVAYRSGRKYPPRQPPPYSERVAEHIEKQAKEEGLTRSDSQIAENLLGILMTHGIAKTLDGNDDLISHLLGVLARGQRMGFIEGAIKEAVPEADPVAVNAIARIVGLILDGDVNGPNVVDTLSRGAFLSWVQREHPEAAEVSNAGNFLYLVYRSYHPLSD